MGKPDVDETEIEAGAKAIEYHYGDVIGEHQARNIAYVVLCAARRAKSKRGISNMTKYSYTFMEVKVVDWDGNTANEKFFLGRLPKVGEAVEMVLDGIAEDGTMRFQLRVKEGNYKRLQT